MVSMLFNFCRFSLITDWESLVKGEMWAFFFHFLNLLTTIGVKPDINLSSQFVNSHNRSQ